MTGDQKYLDEAKFFLDQRGHTSRRDAYSQAHKPVVEQDEAVGHAVRAGYLYSGVADVAALTGDTAYFHALTRIWENMAGRKLYLTGGIGSRAQGEGFGPDYELNNHTAYCETCASIANVYWNHRMFLATGDSRYEDVLERALYNGVISGVSLSGDRFFYDNPLESMGQHERQAWFGCACCPGNVTRFMASVPNYMYATQGKDVFVNLYIQSTAHLSTSQNKIEICQTNGLSMGRKNPHEPYILKRSRPLPCDAASRDGHKTVRYRPTCITTPEKERATPYKSTARTRSSVWKTVTPSSCGNGRKATRCNWISRWTYAGWKPVAKWKTTGEKPPSNGDPSSTA